ncbi:transcriptional regulator with XRE-family HTH domain [Okibacterium sp. HSC-33S16]|uniref:helix-turn-helix transcriptional regulator n=1 Tax=Okibacterium sp. HSC-33S16 TaxID=2910965 RepID=UPI0020A071B1|nr:helix-turn-helix transcriptional regulator [Okibacterium sp. HSC-33S16]MCP2030214.1 transcriptional regulator with XRE-family HTH domain [Okibacterium sp. HSC-33S16]
MRGNPLGLYLTAKRAQIRPVDVGLPSGDTHRRVQGLRREEVAALSGVSAQYYLRLEQGTDDHPSAQVLEAIARALRLDPASTDHLYHLAHSALPEFGSQADGEIDESVRWLLESWTTTPAIVHNRHLDVLASNSSARALSAEFAEGTNLLITLLLSPAQREFYENWEGIAEGAIAFFRALVGPDTDDPRLQHIVDELSGTSELFRRVWARGDVRFASAGIHRIRHPAIGALELHHQNLVLTGGRRQSLFIYHAAPGSPSQRSLALLSTGMS